MLAPRLKQRLLPPPSTTVTAHPLTLSIEVVGVPCQSAGQRGKLHVRKRIAEPTDPATITTPFPTTSRRLCSRTDFDCVLLVLSNVRVPTLANESGVRVRLHAVLEMIAGVRHQTSGRIVALSGWMEPDLEEKAREAGADSFFPMPTPPDDLWAAVKGWFGDRRGPRLPRYSRSQRSPRMPGAARMRRYSATFCGRRSGIARP